MKLCPGSCFECPWRRDSAKDIPGVENLREFFIDHVATLSNPIPYICPEQGDVCFGQVQLFANCAQFVDMDPFSQITEWAMELKPDLENFFWQRHEFIWYHETGFMFGVRYFKQWKTLHYPNGGDIERARERYARR